ncbi:MAG: ABC transporter substrate-binding protein, partial [Candidatus Hodarchaeales archaeon]
WSFLKVHLKEGFGSGADFDNYKQGGRFTVSLPEQMESTNILNSNSAYTHMTLNLVYDGLYKYNPYSLEDCAWLATDWLVEEVDPANLAATPGAVEGDLTKITYHLRNETILWHDGQELTSEDVAYSYTLVNESNSPVYLTAVQDVTHVEIPDAKTVEIFCKIGGLFTLHRTSLPVFPKHIWEPISNPLTWSNSDPVGSGPYKWKSRTPGELVVLERNDGFIYNPRNYGGSPVTTTTSSSISTATTTTTTTTTTTANNPPHITVLYPNGGEEISGEITIMWSGGDDDGDQIAYDVFISPDIGQTWIQLADDIIQNYFEWNTQYYADGNTYLVKIVANDWADSTVDLSDGVFSIVNENNESSTETSSINPVDPFSSEGFDMTSIILLLPLISIKLIRKNRMKRKNKK